MTGFLAVISNKRLPFQFLLPLPAPPPGLPPPILVRFANLWNEEINYHKFSDTRSEAQRLVCTWCVFVCIYSELNSIFLYIEWNTQGIHKLHLMGHCLNKLTTIVKTTKILTLHNPFSIHVKSPVFHGSEKKTYKFLSVQFWLTPRYIAWLVLEMYLYIKVFVNTPFSSLNKNSVPVDLLHADCSYKTKNLTVKQWASKQTNKQTRFSLMLKWFCYWQTRAYVCEIYHQIVFPVSFLCCCFWYWATTFMSATPSLSSSYSRSRYHHFRPNYY